jgi:hypothetical protein
VKEGEARLNLEGARPQKPGQLELPFMSRGEASSEGRSVEASTAERGSGHPGSKLMELALTRPNLKAALKRVRKNKGGPGIDGMTTEELLPYLWKRKDAVSWWTWTWRRFSKAQCVTSTSRTARCETRMPGGVAGAAGVTRPPYADPYGAGAQSRR